MVMPSLPSVKLLVLRPESVVVLVLLKTRPCATSDAPKVIVRAVDPPKVASLEAPGIGPAPLFQLAEVSHVLLPPVQVSVVPAWALPLRRTPAATKAAKEARLMKKAERKLWLVFRWNEEVTPQLDTFFIIALVK
jgi:hypothetical protein